VHNLLLSDEPRQRQPDITLAKEALGWGPKTNLNVGLDKTIAYVNGWLAQSQRPA
jgi:UDP-glucuronate decarboxylase